MNTTKVEIRGIHIALALLAIIVAIQSFVIWDLKNQVRRQHTNQKRERMFGFPRSFKPWFDNWMFGPDENSLFSTLPNVFQNDKTPTMTLRRNPNEVIVHLTLPSKDRDNIKIEAKDGLLRVALKYEIGPNSKGTFDQSISIPEGLDVSKMKTQSTSDGMDIIIPRARRRY